MWQVKLCDPLSTEHDLSALRIRSNCAMHVLSHLHLQSQYWTCMKVFSPIVTLTHLCLLKFVQKVIARTLSFWLLKPVHPQAEWHKLTYLVLTCPWTSLNQSIIWKMEITVCARTLEAQHIMTSVCCFGIFFWTNQIVMNAFVVWITVTPYFILCPKFSLYYGLFLLEFSV